MVFIGLDVGTTGVKACVFDADGAIRGYAFREYDVICAEPGMGEQDADLVWKLTLEVLREAVSKSGDAASITSLSLSVQGDAIIAADTDFHPLYPAILGMDYRSEPQARQCAERFGDRALFDRTGMRPHPMNSVVKMLWLKERRPGVFAQAKRIVTYADYIAGRLTGEAVIDHTMASRTMCFDLKTRAWACDLLEKMGIAPQLLSRPEQSGKAIGTLLPDIAAATGLGRGVIVAAGGHDQSCAALGAGGIDEGRAVISTGTAEVMSAALRPRTPGKVFFESYYPLYCHTVPDMLFTFALLHSGGIVFKWYRDNLGTAEAAAARQSGADPYDLITQAMPEGPSPVMLMPHFNGSGTPLCDMRSKGAIVGLTMAATRHDIAKAALEGLCFELRINLDRMQDAGVEIEELIAVGGGAKSKTWLQLKADILGRPIATLAVREAACLGAGLLAAKAAGVYPSLADAVKATVRHNDAYHPRPDMAAAYASRFEIYRGLHAALKPVNERL